MVRYLSPFYICGCKYVFDYHLVTTRGDNVFPTLCCKQVKIISGLSICFSVSDDGCKTVRLKGESLDWFIHVCDDYSSLLCVYSHTNI